MRTLLRFLMFRRLLDQSRRHRRHGWGSGYGRRPSYGWGYGRRPRGRSQVRVTGCCLPIPLGMLAFASLAARVLVARVRG